MLCLVHSAERLMKWMCIYIPHVSHHVLWRFTILLSEIERQPVKVPLAAAISPYLISLTHPTHMGIQCEMKLEIDHNTGNYVRALLFKAYGIIVAQTSLMMFTCLVTVCHCGVALSVFVLEKNKAAFLQVPLPFTSPTAEVKGYVESHVVQKTLRRWGAHNSSLFQTS